VLKIPFKISARTAKLIGRENFSNPEGAIIELVKNSYDADAKDCLVVFDIPIERIPSNLSIKDYKKHFNDNKIISQCYKLEDDSYSLLSDLSQEQLDSLTNYFFTNNSIYIIDNGHGMTNDIVRNQWMEIGTGNKEINFISDDKRIKTGAKGIGRFALDRLGYLSEMWTVPKGKRKIGSYWKMDWRQFDITNIKLNEVEAEIEEKQFDLPEFLKSIFKDRPKLSKKISETSFSSGTIIKISHLKDNWPESNQESVFKSLEALIPPKELAIPFGVSLYCLQNTQIFGEVETAFFNDYDYKVDALFDSKKSAVEFTIIRNELDLKEVKAKYSYLFKNNKIPYDLKTLTGKKFDVPKTVFELLKWEQNSANSVLLKNLGDFSFSFYFLKNTNQGDYPYREFNQSERQKVLRKFGGIKIYRDSFRVRPYGDPGNDWLKLGDRAAQSPAGAGQRIGDWRVGPNQIAGLVKISRVENHNLIDKSDRGALIENESFNILKRVLIGIINEFEIDRSIILNPFYLDSKEKEKKERETEIRIEAEKLANKIIEERNKVENKVFGNKLNLFTETKEKQEKKSYQKIIEEGLQKIEKREEDNAEIAQVRTLASLGLIVSSFAHELNEVKNNSDDIDDLEKIYCTLITEDKKSSQAYKDGANIIESLKIDSKKIAHWVEYSLTAIKKDKRKRSSLKFENFFNSLKKQWEKVLTDRNIKLVFTNNISKPYLFRAFEMDMNTIFSNLISNSIDAFNNLKKIRDRNISITIGLIRNNIEIVYSDTGTGLPKIFHKEKETIFLPFTTSKKDKDGNDIGTGLGMYLVKNVVNDNNGAIEILDTPIGFKLKIKFPARNN
jgi:signal transduction histidine kinase